MQYPFIRCYHPNFPVPAHSFFMLSKGENAGKPASAPWANSFLVICANEGFRDFYFWLSYGLWHAGSFKACLRGTTVQFINISDVRDIFRGIGPYIHKDWKRYKEILNMLEMLEERKSTLAEQILATQNIQQALLQKYFSISKKGVY